MLRSSSSPILTSLVSEADHDCAAFSKPFSASHHCIPLLGNRGFSSKHTLSIHRSCSETDLHGWVHSLAEPEVHIGTAEKQHLSIIQEKEQFRVEKEGFTKNGVPYSKQSMRLTASSSSHASASHVHDGLQVNECERFIPLHMAGGIGISSDSEEVIMNVGGGVWGCNGGKGGSGGCGSGTSISPNDDSNATDLYYQKLLQSDPQNPLFLRNYAQFLSEAKHDYKKSEEYYERAILASPKDGEILSKYAKQVWEVHKDSERAGSYFDQAVKATPDDCYVLGSYASFLWESEEDEEDTNKALRTTFHSAPSPLVVSV